MTDPLRAALDREERDHAWTLRQRDEAIDAADDLANNIAGYLGVDIGEHSNANDPWQNALDAIPARPTGYTRDHHPKETCPYPNAHNQTDPLAHIWLAADTARLGLSPEWHAELALVEAESRNATLDEVVRAVEGLPHSGTVWTGDPLVNRAAVLDAVKGLQS